MDGRFLLAIIMGAIVLASCGSSESGSKDPIVLTCVWKEATPEGTSTAVSRMRERLRAESIEFSIEANAVFTFVYVLRRDASRARSLIQDDPFLSAGLVSTTDG